jgi:hypothetical protein
MSVTAENAPVLPVGLLYAVAALVDKFLLQGIFMRGGISMGWAYHHNNIIFGEAMIRAYKLESEVAHVPRILIADDIVASLNTYKFAESHLRQDSDGMWYCKPFSTLVQGPDDMPDPFLLHIARKRISHGLTAAKDAPQLISKYRWLCNRFDEHIAECEQRWHDERDFGKSELVPRFHQPQIGIYLGATPDGSPK